MAGAARTETGGSAGCGAARTNRRRRFSAGPTWLVSGLPVASSTRREFASLMAFGYRRVRPPPLEGMGHPGMRRWLKVMVLPGLSRRAGWSPRLVDVMGDALVESDGRIGFVASRGLKPAAR